MKSKELIRQILECDPTGEEEVSVGNVDIMDVCSEPSYWNGKQEILIRDPNSKFYNVIGAKYRARGNKVVIIIFPIHDALWENPNLPVDYSELSHGEYKKSDDKVRELAKDSKLKLELGIFQNYIKNKAAQLTSNLTDLSSVAQGFFLDNLSPNDPFPSDIPWQGNSYISRREKQWDRQLSIIFEDLEIKIIHIANQAIKDIIE